ncbi:hypothetical protein QNA24_30100 [Rhodococcus qingshengii]|nr:hypothetical protein [Rhodococcus qingshengii]MDJ0490636.1 hypothetical protein [Rhodococcus qingshengii]
MVGTSKRNGSYVVDVQFDVRRGRSAVLAHVVVALEDFEPKATGHSH